MLPGHTQPCTTPPGRTQKVGCVWRLCALYSAVCLSLWQPSDAAQRRCGSELLADLIFVCGDRGIYLGRGNWSGYGSRPRRKGIADHCCQPGGCDLRHLEMYCAKPKKPEAPPDPSTSSPTFTTATGSTAGTAHATSTATAISTPTAIEAVFRRRLLDIPGPPNSRRRASGVKKTHKSARRRKVFPSSRKGPAR